MMGDTCSRSTCAARGESYDGGGERPVDFWCRDEVCESSRCEVASSGAALIFSSAKRIAQEAGDDVEREVDACLLRIESPSMVHWRTASGVSPLIASRIDDLSGDVKFCGSKGCGCRELGGVLAGMYKRGG